MYNYRKVTASVTLSLSLSPIQYLNSQLESCHVIFSLINIIDNSIYEYKTIINIY